MIRKAIIVVLTLGAVATSTLNWRSYSNTIRREFRLTSKVVLFVQFSDGFSRLFWWSCEEDFVIEIRTVSSWNNENVIFPRTLSWCYYPAWALTPAEKIRETGMSSYKFLSETIRPTRGPGNPSLYYGFFRLFSLPFANRRILKAVWACSLEWLFRCAGRIIRP